MKIFFLFFLLLPAVSALAVSPTSLDLTDGSSGVMYVYNTLEKEVYFEIDGLQKENFTLIAGEVNSIEVSIYGERPGHYEGELLVKEISEDGFVNAIVIPVEYSGVIPHGEKEAFPIELVVSLFPITTLLVFLTWYFYKKKRKKGV